MNTTVTKNALGLMLSLAGAWTLSAQGTSDTILTIEMENAVFYYMDTGDVSRIATSSIPVPVAANIPYGMKPYMVFADLVTVNSQPVRGTMMIHGQILNAARTPIPGRVIADIQRSYTVEMQLEILGEDGGQIGLLVGLGFAAGAAPPGAPRTSASGNFAITGGTGAFLGVRGQAATVSAAGLRTASMAEDPAFRRMNGGGRWTAVVHLTGVSTSEIVGVYHGDDFSPVTPARPAHAGETLMLYARGLSPTTVRLNPGDPFPSEPLAIATSPIEVLVNGKSSPAINQVGVPGTTDTYRVDFRMPDDAAVGTANVQISAAWIKGATVPIPVR